MLSDLTPFATTRLELRHSLSGLRHILATHYADDSNWVWVTEKYVSCRICEF
jgi:hypothetical protein